MPPCHANGGYVALDVFHGVVYRESVSYTAAGAVDVKTDILCGILTFKVKQLRHDDAGGRAVDFFIEHDDPVVQKAGVNVIRTLASVGLLNYIWYQWHIIKTFLFICLD